MARPKRFLFAIVAGILAFGALEGLCALLPILGLGPLADARALSSAYSSLVRNSLTSPDQFDYDPVLGFRTFDTLTWVSTDEIHRFRNFAAGGTRDLQVDLTRWIATLKEAMSKRAEPLLVLTLGGSTTASNDYGDNWPAYVPAAARQRGARQPIFVLNGGHDGFTTFQEKIFLTSWLLPLLKADGLQPQLVIALDGFNDVNFSVLGHAYYERLQLPIWYARYQGYHQRLAERIDRLNREQRPLITVNADHWIVRLALRALPNTAQTLIAFKNRAGGDEGQELRLPEDAAAGEKWLIVSGETRATILDAFRSNLVDLAGACAARDIRFRAFLQPIFLPQYAPGPLADGAVYPDVHSSPEHLPGIGGDFFFDWSDVYRDAEELYRDMGAASPGTFLSLTQVFQAHQDTHNYLEDMVHYSDVGSRIIAQAIVDALIADSTLRTD